MRIPVNAGAHAVSVSHPVNTKHPQHSQSTDYSTKILLVSYFSEYWCMKQHEDIHYNSQQSFFRG